MRTVGLTYDADPGIDLHEGDVLESVYGKALYRVVHTRKIRSRYPNRWALRCIRIIERDIDIGDTVLPLVWYPRGRRGGRWGA